MGHSLKYICVCICVCVCLYLPGGMLSNSICYTHRALSNLLNHAISILCPISWTHIWLQHPPPPRIQVPRVIWEWRDPPIRIHFPLSFFVNLDWQGWATVAHNLHKTLGNKKSLPAMCPEYHTGAGQLTLTVSSLRRQDLLHSTSSPLSNDGAPSLGEFSLRFHPEVRSWEPAHCLESSWGSHTCSGSLDALVLSQNTRKCQRWDPSSCTRLPFSAFLPSFTLLFVSRSPYLEQWLVNCFKKSHFYVFLLLFVCSLLIHFEICYSSADKL